MVLLDEIIYFIDTVLTIVTSTVSINSADRKVRYNMDCYILHTISLVITLLCIITIICHRYAKHSLKLKKASCRAKKYKNEE